MKLVLSFLVSPSAKSPLIVILFGEEMLSWVKIEFVISVLAPLLPLNRAILPPVPLPVMPEVPPPPPLAPIKRGWEVKDNTPLPLDFRHAPSTGASATGKVKVRLLAPEGTPACKVVVYWLAALAKTNWPVLPVPLRALPKVRVVVAPLARAVRPSPVTACFRIELAMDWVPVNMAIV